MLSSMEGLQIGTPQVGSSGLPVPSKELGLAAQTKEWGFKLLRWRTSREAGFTKRRNTSRYLRWKDYRPEPLRPNDAYPVTLNPTTIFFGP